MNKLPMDAPVDLVLPWVDGADPAWRKEKAAWTDCGGDDRVNRYRDWDNLQYVFRGIEKNLPWIRKVHFVTWGHLPEWLNTECPRLHIVSHRDYIPETYLPVFSSHPIELNLHRIEGLAEQFIYTNDDIFFLQPQSREAYFREGIPVDRGVQNVLQFRRADGIDHVVANDLGCINRNFDKRTCMKENLSKWFSPRYGIGGLKNLYLLAFRNFTGFEDPHMPCAYRKETFRQVWQREPELLDRTCHSRIRSDSDVNQWLMRYWQLASGNFVPGKREGKSLFSIGQEDGAIREAVLGGKCVVCLSDDDPELDFRREKAFLRDLLEAALPEKSMFER